MVEKVRCDWPGNDEMMVKYHDEVWGKPLHDDRELFEFLILEGAQAGLSWSTILKRREGYLKAFDNYDIKKISNYNQTKKNNGHNAYDDNKNYDNQDDFEREDDAAQDYIDKHS